MVWHEQTFSKNRTVLRTVQIMILIMFAMLAGVNTSVSQAPPECVNPDGTSRVSIIEANIKDSESALERAIEQERLAEEQLRLAGEKYSRILQQQVVSGICEVSSNLDTLSEFLSKIPGWARIMFGINKIINGACSVNNTINDLAEIGNTETDAQNALQDFQVALEVLNAARETVKYQNDSVLLFNGLLNSCLLEHGVDNVQVPNTEIPISCEGSPTSRLVVGQQGRVTPGPGANNLRDIPSKSGVKVGQILESDTFSVLEGPVCADGLAWWKISIDGLIAWTVEGQGTEYWLEPFDPGHPLIKNTSTDIKKDIVGVWFDPNFFYSTASVEFFADGTVSMQVYESGLIGTYTFIANNRMQITGEWCNPGDCGPSTWETEVAINGNTLSMVHVNGEYALWERVK